MLPEWNRPDRVTVDIPPSPQEQQNRHFDERELPTFDEGENRSSSFGNENEHPVHEHLLKSGALGKCDDPFCTTCPSYFGLEYGRTHTPERRPSYLGRAKSVFSEWTKGLTGIYHPHTKFVQRWNQFVALSCLLAVFVDPLFFFILSVRQGIFCIEFNVEFARVVTALRTITDFIYFVHMLLQFRLAYFGRQHSLASARTGVLIDDPRAISRHYLRGWFLVDLFAVLPIPQIILWSVVKRFKAGGGANFLKNLLRVIVMLQYVPRMIRMLPLLFGGSQSRLTFETAWANFTINLLLYLLAGHVIGSTWYLFGLQRVNQCLRNNCIREANCTRSFLDCGSGTFNMTDAARAWRQASNSSNECLVPTENTTFSYGIYQPAVAVTMERSSVHKYVYSLFWGFLQISTLGGNLVPSLFPGEVLFTTLIIGLGLLMFALLIGNMQNFLQSLGRRQLDMQLKRYDVESWMKRRRLPADLRSRVRQAVRLKWASTRGINEEKVLDRLPEDLQKEIRRFLCFVLVKKVRIFTVMNEQVLDAICERLHQMLYIEGSEVFRTDAKLNRMLFIVRGTLESVGQDGSRHILLPGDFCGEELLIWYLERTVQQKRNWMRRRNATMAVSSRTVKCLTSVEAFSLEAKDMEYVTENYPRLIRNSRVQGAIRYVSPYFRGEAAVRIQAAWRSYKRRSDLIRL